MYINTGYLNHSHLDFKDKSRPLVVGSCGIYRLSGDPRMPTYRPKGRLDYQIIYIASGLGHFHFDKPENETIVPAGNMVLFRPKELQKYEYYGEDKTEVYWIHFTGSDVKIFCEAMVCKITREFSPSVPRSSTSGCSNRSYRNYSVVRNTTRKCLPCCFVICLLYFSVNLRASTS